MRGENMWHVHLQNLALGSPPLARGKQTTIIMPFHSPGITPACAGKTPRTVAQVIYLKDHPRLRGENPPAGRAIFAEKGSPPLARGKLEKFCTKFNTTRITPACAGKTQYHQVQIRQLEDHPRLRGENFITFLIRTLLIGSPPLARGKLKCNATANGTARITPACAGKTDFVGKKGVNYEDHPRLRGENLQILCTFTNERGSPPLARGKQLLTEIWL